MKKILTTLIVLLPCFSFGQTLSPQTLATSGGFASTSSVNLSSTFGAPFNSTMENGSSMLTQGMQQPYVFLQLIHVKVFLEAFYQSGGIMAATLYDLGVSTNPMACDTIVVELHDPNFPDSIVASVHALLLKNGRADVQLPASILNGAYYLVVRHRNTLETWSKNPFTFKDAFASFDWTAPE